MRDDSLRLDARGCSVYFSTHEEANLKEHADGVMGHGSFRRLVLQRLLEDEMVYVRPGLRIDAPAVRLMWAAPERWKG